VDDTWLRYDVVDVFTDRPFAGNQLAVVHGAGDLGTEQCLAITREFGYSETTFPGDADGTEYATRIFTPEREIPFAGHPTLGTAWVLRDQGRLSAEECVQVCGAGRIGVRFPDGQVDRVELSADPRNLVGPLPEDLVGDLLALVGLGAADAAGPAYVAGTGLPFVHLRVTDDAVGRAVPVTAPFGPLLGRLAAAGAPDDLLDALDVHAVSGRSPHLQVHARVFVPGAGVPEDPATGSSAAGLGMVLVASGLLPEGGTYDVTQGLEMRRPSLLRGRVEAVGGAATRCHVAGQVRPVASGRIAVPPPPAGLPARGRPGG